MATSDDVKALLEKVPDLDKRDAKIPLLRTRPSDGKLTGPTWGDAEEIVKGIFGHGRQGVAAVIDLVTEVDDGKDYRARYMLHVLATYTCRKGKDEQQGMVVDAILSKLTGEATEKQAFLVHQLQVCAGRDAAGRLGKLLASERLCEPAALALVAIGGGAAEQFRAALPRARGPARRTIVQALAVLGDEASLRTLRGAMEDGDADVRLSAAWGLANLGDGASYDMLLRAADGAKDWQRAQMTKACLILAEKLLAAGRKAEARKIYTHLRDTRGGQAESYIRQAAAKALKAM